MVSWCDLTPLRRCTEALIDRLLVAPLTMHDASVVGSRLAAPCSRPEVQELQPVPHCTIRALLFTWCHGLMVRWVRATQTPQTPLHGQGAAQCAFASTTCRYAKRTIHRQGG